MTALVRMVDPERTLPQNVEAERVVLGAALLYEDGFARVASVVGAGDFSDPRHAVIFEAMGKVAKRGAIVDFVTVRGALGTRLDEAGGAGYLASLIDGVPVSRQVERHASIVKEKALLRDLIFRSHRIIASAYETEEAIDDVLSSAERELRLISSGQPMDGLRKLATFIPRAMDQIEAWTKTPGGITGVPSGFVDLDALTRGFHPGTLVIIAARPGMGKSSFVLNIAQHVASLGKAVAFFSLEMSEDELTMRSIAGEAHIDSHMLQSGRIKAHEWDRLSAAFGALAELELYIDASPFVTVFDIKARSRRLAAQQPLGLIVVDYTQLMVGHEKHQNRALEVAAITRALKGLAKDLSVPVLALSQLNRDLERRENKHPQLSDLRDSGALEQDADLVLFIYRDEVYHEQSTEQGIAELIIAKHRSGHVGTVRVGWKAEETRFVNLERRHEADRRFAAGDR